MKGLRGGREHVRLRVLEAEHEIDVGLRDDRLERRRDVLRARLVLAVDEPELPLRLGARRIEHALAVGGEQPVLLGVEESSPPE